MKRRNRRRSRSRDRVRDRFKEREREREIHEVYIKKEEKFLKWEKRNIK